MVNTPCPNSASVRVDWAPQPFAEIKWPSDIASDVGIEAKQPLRPRRELQCTFAKRISQGPQPEKNVDECFHCWSYPSFGGSGQKSPRLGNKRRHTVCMSC